MEYHGFGIVNNQVGKAAAIGCNTAGGGIGQQQGTIALYMGVEEEKVATRQQGIVGMDTEGVAPNGHTHLLRVIARRGIGYDG